MILEHAKLLTEKQVGRIHEASLEILKEVGLIVRNEKAFRIFADNGCHADSDDLIVRFPPSLIDELLTALPSSIMFWGRDPKYDVAVPRSLPVVVSAGGAPNVIDSVTGLERRATSDDIARASQLFDSLPGYDVVFSTLADDAPIDEPYLFGLYATLKNTSKPVRTLCANIPEAEKMLQLGALIAGSKAAYRERPFFHFAHCPIVSPLTMDYESCEMAMYHAKNNNLSWGAISPNSGISAPMTLVGTVTQINAEWLALMTLQQIIRPGYPSIHVSLPVVTDMRTGAYALGGIETGIMSMALAQIAGHYGVPSAACVSVTNANTSDAQAGYETSMSGLAAFLGGMNILITGGLYDSLLTFDLGQTVIDNEIMLMVKHLARGMEFSEENLSLDIIRELGPGKMFIDHPSTFTNMRDMALLTDMADRNARQVWIEQGSTDIHSRALRRAQEILSAENDSVFSDELDRKIRSVFPYLCKGDARLPDGWEKVVAEAPTRRKNSRRTREKRAKV